MKILSISTDRKVFEKGSAVRTRLIEYGGLADELHVIVFAKRALGFFKETVSPNIFLYPTNAWTRFGYVPHAIICALALKRRGVSIDVVTTQDPFECGVAGYLIARILCARFHIQVHTDFMSPYFVRESLLNKIRVRIAKFLLPRTDAIRVVSERIKKSLIASCSKIHASRIAVLPIFVDVQKIKDASIKTDLRAKYPHFDFIALMASRFTKEKNIPMAISAMAEVVKKYPKAGLIIVGSGPEEQKLKLLATHYSLLSHVIFEPWTDDLASYYKIADIFALTSDYEGYGRTIIEAEAAGCLVIMTDVGIAGDVIKNGENGLVVPVGDVQALTSAILSVIGKKAVLRASLPKQPSKEEYLDAYRASWENTLNS